MHLQDESEHAKGQRSRLTSVLKTQTADELRENHVELLQSLQHHRAGFTGW